MSWKEIGKFINDTIYSKRGKRQALNRIIEDETYNTYYYTMLTNIDLVGDTDSTFEIIPIGKEEIEANKYEGNTNFYNILIPVTVKSIGEEAFLNSKISTVIIPPSVETIGTGAFALCTNLFHIKLPPGLKVIPESAFESCSFFNIDLPRNITDVERNAFKDCGNLNLIKFYSKPTMASNIFSGCSNLIDIYVPWSEDEVPGAPWGATNATIHYNTEV